ncbi:SAM-dependent methyltransferase, partial [Streptomyces sp. NPDC059558]
WGGGSGPPPPPPALCHLSAPPHDLATTVDRVVADGWTPVHGHVSSRRELDDYEWSCWGSLASWALDRPGDPDAAEALATATARRTEWLHSYRDSFGFLTLVLRPTSG